MAPRQFAKVQELSAEASGGVSRSQPLEPRPQQRNPAGRHGASARLFDQILRKIPELQERLGDSSAAKAISYPTPRKRAQLQELRRAAWKNPYEPPAYSALVELGYSKELLYAGPTWTLDPAGQRTLDNAGDRQQVAAILFTEEDFQNGFHLGSLPGSRGHEPQVCPGLFGVLRCQGITIRKGDVRTLGKRPLNDLSGGRIWESNPPGITLVTPQTGLKPAEPTRNSNSPIYYCTTS